MTVKKKRSAKQSQLSKQVEQYAGLLEKGRVLAIDPSSGSNQSMPGYAYIEEGTLVESGTIEIAAGSIGGRLWSLSTLLRNEFDGVEVLIIENLPPYMRSSGGGSSFRSRATQHLHMSVGAIYGALGSAVIIDVAPTSWHSDVKKLPFSYVKGDENDALMLAYAAYSRADIEVEGLLEKVKENCYYEVGHNEILPRPAEKRAGRSTKGSRSRLGHS